MSEKREATGYDAAFRWLLRDYTAGMLAWLLREPAGSVEYVGRLDARRLAEVADGQLANDFVAEFRIGPESGRPRLALIEAEYQPRRGLAGRLFRYVGSVLMDLNPTDTPGDEYSPTVVVIALTGRSLASRDTRTPAGVGALLKPAEWNLQDLVAAELFEGIEKKTVPWPALVWLPLARGATDPDLMARFLAFTLALPNERDRGNVRALTPTFANAVGTASLWRDLLKEVNMIRIPYVEEMREEGRVEARLETSRALLISVLETKFGSVPPTLLLRLRVLTDATRIAALVPEAVKAETLDAFAAAVG